ncbi:MAG: response regulator, partial [Nitrospinae bacterium]|nr:response regulator [Nitrospinota bacterium]
MKDEPITVLLIEDNPGDARLLREMVVGVRGAQFELEWADRLSAGLEGLARGGIDVVLLDLSLPDSQGVDTIVRVQAQAPGVPIVVLTSLDDESLTLKALQEGAQDYLVKGSMDSKSLLRSLRYAIERHRMLAQLEKTNAELRRLASELEDRVVQRTAEVRAKSDEVTAISQQLWQTAKLATMGELAASIAHELNNPLATVSLRIESLLTQVPETDPKRRALDVIEQEVERMGALVGNLLQFSRRGEPQISSIDVRTELENTLALIPQ